MSRVKRPGDRASFSVEDLRCLQLIAINAARLRRDYEALMRSDRHEDLLRLGGLVQAEHTALDADLREAVERSLIARSELLP